MLVITTVHRSSAARSTKSVVVATVGAGLAVLRWGAAGALIGLVVAVAVLAAIVDVRTSRIPNPLIAAATVPTLAVIALESSQGSGARAALAVTLGVLGVAGPMFVVHMVSPAALGFGDVKLGAALGGALGLIDPGLGLLALCIASGATGLVGLIARRESLAFGPGLVLGVIVALVIAGQLDREVLPWR